MKKYLKIITKSLLIVPLCASILSCGDYLDVVPTEIPSLEDAFLTKNKAEGFLIGLFSYLPEHGNPVENPALTGGDELFFRNTRSALYGFSPYLWYFMSKNGSNSTGQPACNYFASVDSENKRDLRGGIPLFTAIRDCNTFLEYITDDAKKPFDLGDKEKDYWVGNANFLKAYFYFWLFRMYGPIPIIHKNLPITATASEAQKPRSNVDDVVETIVQLLDEAIPNLPLTLDNPDGVGGTITKLTHLGVPTRVAAKALQAEVLVYAASPLFNNNTTFADYGKDENGKDLFPQDGDYVGKWVRARDSLAVAIKFAEDNGNKLYKVGDLSTGSDYTDVPTNPAYEPLIAEMEVRSAVTNNPLQNTELIWGDSRRADLIEYNCRLLLDNDVAGLGNSTAILGWAPTLTIVEQFYSKNGVPIEQDLDWQGHLGGFDGSEGANDQSTGLYALREIPASGEYDIYMMRGGDITKVPADNYTAYLHFDREPRFYGAISFERGRFCGNSATPFLNYPLKETNDQSGRSMGNFTTSIIWSADFRHNHDRQSATGYLCKKMIGTATTMGRTPTLTRYFFPIIRLADLYLMYAEALNESDPNAATGDPNETSDRNSPFTWVNKIRTRTHLQTVGLSWDAHSIYGPAGYNSQDSLRKLIRRERLNEFAFEGQRFWDLRRWNLAEEYMNKSIRGLNVDAQGAQGKNNERPDDFFDVKPLTEKREVGKKVYFWPISLTDLLKNPKLIQSPGYGDGVFDNGYIIE